MIRHVVMFRWTDGTTDDDVAAIAAGLSTMPGLIPQIRAYHYGADLGIVDTNWDFVVVADFDDRDDFVAYRDDANHQALIKESIAPHIKERAAVQYQLD
jgi:hypothetical protein